MDISVIIPCKEDRGFLKYAVESAENQKFKGTWEVIVQQSDSYVGKNMNDGFKRATGTFIKKLDEDDLLPPDSLQLLFDYAFEGGYDWVYSDAMCFKDVPETNEWWKVRPASWFTLQELMQRNRLHGGSVLYHRRTFEQTGGWDETIWTAEEYDWHLLLTAKNFQRGYLPKVTYWQRFHDTSKYNYFVTQHGAERKELREMIIERYRRYCYEFPAPDNNTDEPGAVQPPG
jgi:glycosyltransferase involved in cell wall biosynthesis